MPIIPAAPEWCICLPNKQFTDPKFYQIPILAWKVDDDCNVTPITAFGEADTSGGYVLGMPGMFSLMPNGPAMTFNEVVDHFRRGAQ